MLRTILLVASLAAPLASCSTNADRFDRDDLSVAIEHQFGSSIGPGDDSLPPDVVLGDGVGEDEAVALALWRNAAFQEALAELGLRRADLIQAGEIANPTFWILLPVGPKQIEYTARLPFDFLWQRPYRVAAAELDCERVSALLVQGGLDLVRDVRSAYADLRLAQTRAAIAAERAAVLGDIARFQATRLEAGDASDLEAATGRIEALRAEAEAIRARQDLSLLDNRIRNLIGSSVGRDVALVAGADDAQRVGAQQDGASKVGAPLVWADVDALVTTAMALRPDLRSAEIAAEAAGERAGLARWQVLSVMGLADVNGNGRDGVGGNAGGFQFGPGLDLQVPLLNQNDGAKARARAELEQALRRQRTLSDQIALEVRDACLRRLAADEFLAKQAAMLPLLEAADRQAERAQRAGDQPILAVYMARVSLLDARLRDAEARAERDRADAQLVRSVGGRMP